MRYEEAAAAAPPPFGLPFTAFDDIEVEVAKRWIFKRALARGETSSLVGPPGSGKSALGADMAVHAAAGWDWRGYRCKERCAVLILAFERADLMLRRLDAYKRRNGLTELPIAVVRTPVDLSHPDGAALLIDTIWQVERRFGLPVGLMLVDTYSKALALGGGDENSARDVNRFLGQIRLVQNETSIHALLIGHTGKDVGRGHRGSNASVGDADLEVQISGDTVKSAVVTKANDQPEGPLTTFTLESFDFGTDEDGDAISTSIISADVPERDAKGSQRRGLTDRQKIAMDGLTEALINFGREAPPALQLPRDIRVVDAGQWRDELFTRGLLDRAAPNPRKEFFRLRDALVAKGLAAARDDLVWKCDP